MEKLYSGMSFLYRDGGYNSTVFDIHMKDRVRGDYLTRALNLALTRYPYLQTKLVEKKGDFYLTFNPVSMTAHKTEKLPQLGSIHNGYNILSTTYFEKHIRIAWHHAVCDGRGMKPFIETLLYYYCSLKANRYSGYGQSKQSFDASDIRLAGMPLYQDEETDPFSLGEYPHREPKEIQVCRDGYVLKENAEEWKNDVRYEVEFEAESFMSHAKVIGATPAVYISMLLSKAVADFHPEFDKPIVSSIAIDTREALGFEHTHHNCVGSISLAYTRELDELENADIAKQFRLSMNEQRGIDRLRSITNRQVNMMAKMAAGETLEERQKAFSPFSKICANTFNLSYVGRFILNDYADMVSSIHLYNSGCKGLRTNMIATDSVISLDIIKTFESTGLSEAILERFRQEGLKFTVSNPIVFSTPKDVTQATGKWQGERFSIR